METGTFLERALLVGACALPLLAVGAVVSRDDGDELVPCDGCGERFPPGDLAEGPLETRWCATCNALPVEPLFDCVVEDDGEP